MINQHNAGEQSNNCPRWTAVELSCLKSKKNFSLHFVSSSGDCRLSKIIAMTTILRNCSKRSIKLGSIGPPLDVIWDGLFGGFYSNLATPLAQHRNQFQIPALSLSPAIKWRMVCFGCALFTTFGSRLLSCKSPPLNRIHRRGVVPWPGNPQITTLCR